MNVSFGVRVKTMEHASIEMVLMPVIVHLGGKEKIAKMV